MLPANGKFAIALVVLGHPAWVWPLPRNARVFFWKFSVPVIMPTGDPSRYSVWVVPAAVITAWCQALSFTRAVETMLVPEPLYSLPLSLWSVPTYRTGFQLAWVWDSGADWWL